VIAGCVSDSVSVLLPSIVAAVSIREEHVVLPVGVKDVRARLGLVGFDAARNQVPANLAPGIAVVRCRHADLVDRLGPAVHPFPLAARNIEQLPFPVEAADLRAAQDERLVGRITEDRASPYPA